MIASLLWLAGCPKTPPAPVIVDWSETPHLPAPTAGTYALVPDHPADKAVAQLMTGKTWDASLSGAAAGLALRMLSGTGAMTGPEIRDAAFRAGWPYPVRMAQVWNGTPGSPPPPGVEDWVRALDPTASVGFVRARTEVDEVWLGMVSDARVDIGVIPRQLPAGGRLSLPAVPGGTVWVADPFGRLDHGPLDVPFTRTTDATGEWLVEIDDGQGTIAEFPVYVGMVPPDLSLLVPGTPPTSWQEADDSAWYTLRGLREAYGMPMYGEDPLLDAALATSNGSAFDPKSVAPQLGVSPANLWRWECQATTVEGCLDAVLWDVRARPGLLTRRAVFARQVELNTKGVRIVMLVAGL